MNERMSRREGGLAWANDGASRSAGQCTERGAAWVRVDSDGGQHEQAGGGGVFFFLFHFLYNFTFCSLLVP